MSEKMAENKIIKKEKRIVLCRTFGENLKRTN